VFTLYASAYGTQNLIGHLLTLGSFGLAYQALFATKVRSRIALVHELQRSTARLEKSEGELRAANLSKDRFFSILAHDLRNPLGGFLSLTEVLAGKFHQLENKRVHELCVLLHDGARETTDLLESILQWASAQTGRLVAKPSSLPLAELCEGISAQQQPAARSKEIELETAWPRRRSRADANGDRARSLISNAVVHREEGGRRLRRTGGDLGGAAGYVPRRGAKLFASTSGRLPGAERARQWHRPDPLPGARVPEPGKDRGGERAGKGEHLHARASRGREGGRCSSERSGPDTARCGRRRSVEPRRIGTRRAGPFPQPGPPRPSLTTSASCRP
jgi:hypothetical protein